MLPPRSGILQKISWGHSRRCNPMCQTRNTRGDFTIHINNQNDNETQSFIDCLAAAGLQQHVENYTHRQGNTLDHIYTLAGNALTVRECRTGPVGLGTTVLLIAQSTSWGTKSLGELLQRGTTEIRAGQISKGSQISMDGKRLPPWAGWGV